MELLEAVEKLKDMRAAQVGIPDIAKAAALAFGIDPPDTSGLAKVTTPNVEALDMAIGIMQGIADIIDPA